MFGGIVGAADQRISLTPEARAFLLIGVLGGFTTFSSYEAFMPDLEKMVGDGLITLQRAEVPLSRPGR